MSAAPLWNAPERKVRQRTISVRPIEFAELEDAKAKWIREMQSAFGPGRLSSFDLDWGAFLRWLLYHQR